MCLARPGHALCAAACRCPAQSHRRVSLRKSEALVSRPCRVHFLQLLSGSAGRVLSMQMDRCSTDDGSRWR